MSRREWRDHNVAPSAEVPSPSDDSPLNILVVCTGNICRSPLGEVVLRARLQPLGVQVHSAGTHAVVGHEMTEPAQALAVESGAKAEDAASHTARYLVESMLVEADLVLAMTREHRSHAVRMVPARVRTTYTVREFARLTSALSTEEAHTAADAAGNDPKARLAAVLQAVIAQRGRVTIANPQEDDVVDPYRRSREVYVKSSAQLMPALSEVERILRVALA